jgi:hypothetical protein
MIEYADPTMPLEERCEMLNDVLNQTLDQKEALEREVTALKAQLDGLLEGFAKGGSLGLLQAIGADRTWPIEVRVRALQAAVPFERPRLTVNATANVPKLFDILEAARLRERKVIEAPPVEPVTKLGEGAGEHGAWRDQDHDDPPAA